MVGISLASLTPARMGEASKAILLNKRTGASMTTSLSIVIFERVFDLLFLGVGALIFSLSFLPGVSGIIAFFVILLIIYLLSFLRYFNLVEKFLPTLLKGYFRKVRFEADLRAVLIVLTFTTVMWFFEAGFPWLTTTSFDIRVPLLVVFGIMCLSTLSSIISILPFGLGVLDISFLYLYTRIGLPLESAVSLLIVVRFFSTLLPLFLAFILINWYGLSFKKLKYKEES
jgi:uncharacterized membrane protein YbhN (UPF0104 family)